MDIACAKMASLVEEDGHLLVSWLIQEKDCESQVRAGLYTENYFVIYYSEHFIRDRFRSFMFKDYCPVSIDVNKTILNEAARQGVRGFTYKTLVGTPVSTDSILREMNGIFIGRSKIIEKRWSEFCDKLFESFFAKHGKLNEYVVFLNIQLGERECDLYTQHRTYRKQEIGRETRAGYLVEKFREYKGKNKEKKLFTAHNFFMGQNQKGKVISKISFRRKTGEVLVEVDSLPPLSLSDFFDKYAPMYDKSSYIEYMELLFNIKKLENKFHAFVNKSELDKLTTPTYYTIYDLSIPHYTYTGSIIIETLDADGLPSVLSSSILEELKNIFHAFKIEYQKENIRREAIKSAIAAIMSRNMSHNLGSHVVTNAKHQIEDLEKRQNDDIVREQLKGVSALLQYMQERQDFIAVIANDEHYPKGPLNFKNAVFDILAMDGPPHRHSAAPINNYILDNIVRSEGIAREHSIAGASSTIDIEIQLVKVSASGRFIAFKSLGSQEICNEFSDFTLSVNNGLNGRQALLTILENIIRNSAKHDKEAFNNLENNTLLFSVIFRKEKYPENGNEFFEITICDNKKSFAQIKQIFTDPQPRSHPRRQTRASAYFARGRRRHR